MSKALNGFDTEILEGVIDAIKKDPKVGQAVFNAETVWKDGFHCVSTIKDYELGGKHMLHKSALKIEGDHPKEVIVGLDRGANAVEGLIAMLGICIGGTMATHATTMGVSLDSLKLDLAGDLDFRGFFGMDDINPGLPKVTGTAFVKSDAPKEKVQELLDLAVKLSPVANSLKCPIEINLEMV